MEDWLAIYALVGFAFGVTAATMGDDFVSSVGLFFVIGLLWIVFVPFVVIAFTLTALADWHNRRVLNRWLKTKGLL